MSKAFDCKRRSFQQIIHDAVNAAPYHFWGLFADKPGAVKKGLGFLIGSATIKSELARPDTLLCRTANWDAYAGTSSSPAKPVNVLLNALMLDLPGQLVLVIFRVVVYNVTLLVD